MQRAFGVSKIHAKSSGVLTVVPPDTPYFYPRRIKFRSFDCTGETLEDLDFRIGAVSVGGSPQLAINAQFLSETSSSISSKDLSDINWAIFSTAGLARELLINVFNPHDVDILVYTCVEGEPVASLHDDFPDSGMDEAAKEEMWNSSKWKHFQTGSETVDLAPRGSALIPVRPQMTPYIKPWGARYHGRRISDGHEVQTVVAGIICGRRIELGDVSSMLRSSIQETGHRFLEDGPYEAMDRLRAYIGLMEQDGFAGIVREKRARIKNAKVPKVLGIPNRLLEDQRFDGWHEMLDFPAFSTEGLAKEFQVMLYNPWPFSIHASVTICGEALSDLCYEPKKEAVTKKKSAKKRSSKKKTTKRKSRKKSG